MTRKLILLLLSIPILFNGCDDDEEPFVYTDVAPDKTTTSMIPYLWTSEDVMSNHIYYAINENYNSMVQCAWSATHYDMNMDKVPDFSFEVQHYFQYSEDDLPYFDQLLIYVGAWSDAELSLVEGTDGFVKKYASGDVLDYNSFGKFPIHYRTQEGGYLIRIDKDHSLDAAEEFYIAVKTMKDNRAYYGWFLVETTKSPLTLTVKEYALSRIGNREITIGQR